MASVAKAPQPQGESPAGEPSAEPPAELLPGTEIEGRYRVVQVIGVGGTGVVHEVEHLRTGQRLALKTLLDASYAPRLEQEARALARLRSRRVVKVVDLGYHAGAPYLVMSLLEGRRLRDVLETRTRLSLPFIANLALQVCEGLDEAHRAGLVHRDLKPDNLHLRERPGTSPTGPADELAEVTVFDFGVVKIAANEANSMLTRTGSTVGTPYYMSLEQLRGSGAVDALSDIYALSVVLYECLAGARPFEAGTLGDLIYAICSTEPPDLRRACPDAPKEIVDVVMRGLSRTREERPKSTIELARVFAPWADPAFTWWLRVQGIELGTRPPAELGEGHAEAALSDETTQGQAVAPAPRPAPLPAAAAPSKPKAAPGVSAPAAPRPARPAAIRATASLDAAGALPGAPIPFAPPRVPPPAPPSKPSLSSPAPSPPSAATSPATASAAATAPAQRPAASPPVAPSGDRDTPTQMYLAGEAPSEHDDEPAGYSTMALPTADAGAALADALARPPAPAPAPLSNEDRTAIIGGPGALAAPPVFDPRVTGASAAVGLGPASSVGPASAGPGSDRSSLVDVGLTTGSGRAHDPRASYAHSPAQPPSGSAQPASGPEHPSPHATALQSSLDRALDTLGSRGNELGRTLMLRFRAASQETQLVIVIVGAAACAFVLVILLYLLLA